MSESRTKARADLEKLVLHFEKNIYQFKAPTFNEAQTRQFLIDPFFEVLGGDISNKQMLPPYKIEVLPEGRVRSFSGKTNKNQEPLFSSQTAVKEEQREYATFLEYIADDENKAEQRIATKKP
ncbi:MAG TPA: hypothetical protein VJB38_16200, partial [Bacteroidota bacterium]|nr:hypothetical protein [Bacteroidota bacterium]